MRVSSQDPQDSDVVAAAFALIDDVYGSTDSHHAQALLRRRRFSRYHEEAKELRAQVTYLERILHGIQQKLLQRGTPYNLTRAWSRVALHQQQQRKEAEQTNAELRAVIQRQNFLAQQIVTVLHDAPMIVESPRVLKYPQTSPERLLPSINGTLPPRLAEYLDRVQDQALSKPLATAFHNDRWDEWNVQGDTVRCYTHCTNIYPFKLSLVVSEVWKLLLWDEDQADTSYHDVYMGGGYTLSKRPYGCLEMEGQSAMRRVFLADGVVLFACVAVATGPPTAQNVFSEFEMVCTGWIRIARQDKTNPHSPVVVERANQTEYRPVSRDKLQQTKDVRAQLCQVLAFIDMSNRECRGQVRYDLEHRLLCAARA